MIPLAKTTLFVSLVACLLPTLAVQAQEVDEDSPVPQPPSPRSARRSPAPPGDLTPPAPDDGRPNLSEEIRRSFREFELGREVGEPAVPSRTLSPPATAASRGGLAANRQRPEYIIEPPDVLLVEVLDALPGRPISGERLVRPDGRISLGFYGEIPVAGLTIPEVKVRVILQLRKFIQDEVLGLIEYDPKTASPLRDPHTGALVVKDLKENDRVFVDVTAYNSQNCYVLGEVDVPEALRRCVRRIARNGRELALEWLPARRGVRVGSSPPCPDFQAILAIRHGRGAASHALGDRGDG